MEIGSSPRDDDGEVEEKRREMIMIITATAS